MKITFTYILLCLFSLIAFSQTGLIVNEVSQGNSGTREYVELVVVAPAGTCFVDIRNWIIDDNNGDFSGGPITGSGIASGHIRFTNNVQWQNVPTGSIILVYNSADKNTSITLPDDPSDSDNDKVYILPSNSPLLEGCNTSPAVGNDLYTPCTYASPTSWTPIGLANDGDVIQVRTPATAYFHGLAFGDGSCNCIGAGPGVLVDPCTPAGCTAGRVYSFTHNINNDYNLSGNYTNAPVGASETPGTTNNAANATWRNALLCPLPLPAVILNSAVVDNNVILQYQKTQEEYTKNMVLEHSTVTQAWEALAEINYVSSYTHTLHDNEVHFYRILFQDKDGNTKLSNVVSARIYTIQNQDMSIYPNPVSDMVSVKFQNPENGSVQVFDVVGRNVYQVDISNTQSVYTIDTYNWNDGIYVLRFVSNQGQVLTKKFIKTTN